MSVDVSMYTIFAVYFIFFVMTVMIAFRIMANKVKPSGEILENIALRRNGVFEKKYFGLLPRVKFTVMGYDVVIFSFSGEGGSQTIIQCDFKGRRVPTFSITRKSILSTMGKQWGEKKVVFNNPEFDEAFAVHVHGRDELFLHNFVSSEIQRGLLDIKEDTPSVAMRWKKFFMVILRIPTTEEEYDRYLDIAVKMVTRIFELSV